MAKKILVGSAATVLTLALLGGSLAFAQGARHGHGGWGGSWGGGPGAAMIERFDRSGDGQVSQDDVDAVRAEQFAEFDTDGNGVLSLDEYEALWLDAMRTRMVRGFQRFDVDGDAGVTEGEFMRPSSRMVERLDRDGDGVITEAELRERRAEMHGRRGDGPGYGPSQGMGQSGGQGMGMGQGRGQGMGMGSPAD